jgi:Tol biopolymer transport system component
MKTGVGVPIMVVLVFLVAAGMLVYAWRSTPKLVEVSPQPGAEHVVDVSSIRLVFSRPMDQASVSSRLSMQPVTQGTLRWEQNSLVFTPNQPWPDGMKIEVSLASGSRAASWVAFPMGGQSWSFSTRSATLAYLWPSNGKADIYALDPSTREAVQYTRAMNVLDYSASLDGRWLYFSAGNSQGGADLYRFDRLNAESNASQPYQPEKLLDCGLAQCRNPAPSYDGQFLAYEYLVPTLMEALGSAQVWMLSLNGLQATQVGQSDHETVQPEWSSVGDLAYYDRTSSTYTIFTPSNRQTIQFSNQTGQPGTWSPDGLAFITPEISYRQVSGSQETADSYLFGYVIGQPSPVKITSGEAVEDVEAVYSPSGSSIAFTRKYLDAERWTPGRQVWLMDADGSNPRPVTDEPDFNHFDLAFNRDGKSLAYVRFNQVKISDPPELWMVSLDGSQPVQLVVGGYSPIWIP